MNPFRRIKDLEFEVDKRDIKIKNLENEIERLEAPARQEYHPNETCIDCKYCIIEGQKYYGYGTGSAIRQCYYCRLNNNCEDYTLKE